MHLQTLLQDQRATVVDVRSWVNSRWAMYTAPSTSRSKRYRSTWPNWKGSGKAVVLCCASGNRSGQAEATAPTWAAGRIQRRCVDRCGIPDGTLEAMIDLLKKPFGGGPVDYAQLLKEGAVVVDVRSPGEFASGHVKGAINIPLTGLPKTPRRSRPRAPSSPVVPAACAVLRPPPNCGSMAFNGCTTPVLDPFTQPELDYGALLPGPDPRRHARARGLLCHMVRPLPIPSTDP